MLDPLFMYKLKNGLLGTTPDYGGLVDQNAAQGNGLINFGAALLAAGGPSREPTNLGQSLGSALLQGRQATQQSAMQQLQNALIKKQLTQKDKKDLVLTIGQDGKPIWTDVNNAEGKPAGDMQNHGKDATDLQYYQQDIKDRAAQGLPPRPMIDWAKDYYGGKQSMGYTVQNINGVPTRVLNRAPVGSNQSPNPTPLTTLPEQAKGKAAVAAAEAGATTTAKAQAENQVNLGSALDDISKMKQNVKDLLESPGFNTIYGASSLLDPRNYIRGTDAADAQAKRDQLSAEAFAVTIQKMRGLGSLSDAEGKKVTAAYTRATAPGLSDNEARKAWKEVQGYLDLAEQRAKEKAGQADQSAPSAVTDIQSAARAELERRRARSK